MHSETLSKIAYSVLDLATISEGNTATDSFHNSLRLAKHAEQLGYTRFWLAEHHNMPGVASSATAVLIGYIAGGTNSIRVGSGGIMLPNHAPLIVAEQFGTLASLYPGRIDLGLGRAPGTDQLTALAIRGQNFGGEHNFPKDIQQLQAFFSATNSSSKVRAIPGEGLDIPIWILGSSTDSALVAAALGLPYAFASHFAPSQFITATDIIPAKFQALYYLKNTLRDSLCKCGGCRYGCRSSQVGNNFTTIIFRRNNRPTETSSAACGRYQFFLDRGRITHGKTNAGLFVYWKPGKDPAYAAIFFRTNKSRRGNGGIAYLRPGCQATFL